MRALAREREARQLEARERERWNRDVREALRRGTREEALQRRLEALDAEFGDDAARATTAATRGDATEGGRDGARDDAMRRASTLERASRAKANEERRASREASTAARALETDAMRALRARLSAMETHAIRNNQIEEKKALEKSEMERRRALDAEMERERLEGVARDERESGKVGKENRGARGARRAARGAGASHEQTSDGEGGRATEDGAVSEKD